MPARAQISITLPVDQVEAIEAAVAAGDFDSASEVVSTALDGLLSVRALGGLDAAKLRHLCEEGRASGDVQAFSFEEVRRSARRALAERG